MAPLVQLEGLHRSFGDHEVIRGLDLTVAAGERVALIGPNGSGKTTILRCVMGTLLPSGGTATVGGHVAGSPAARRLLGASLSQERSFYMRLTGRQNLGLVARLRGLSRKRAAAAVEELGQELELEDILASRADRCSTGMLQQLAFARALVGEPTVLVLDEPTRSLDKEAQERLWAALDRRRDRAVLVATHLRDDQARVDRAVQLTKKRRAS